MDALNNRKSNFTHPKIHPARDLRLVTLQSARAGGRYAYSFTVVSFADLLTTKYYALSYTWGSAVTEDDIELISVQGQEFWVRRKLFEFTQAAFESSTGDPEAVISIDLTIPIFIDAICINQLDAHEKSFQVMQMADIYRHAYQVITYLGQPPCEDADFANEIAYRLAIFNSRLMSGPKMTISGGPFTMSPLDLPVIDVPTRFTEKDLFAFAIICRDIYWTRLWIVPEVILAPEHWIVWCGTQLFDGHVLAAHLPFMVERESRLRLQEATNAPPPFSTAWRAWHGKTSREAKNALHGAVDHVGGRFGREILSHRFARAWQPSNHRTHPGDLFSRRGTALLNSSTLGSMSLHSALKVFREKSCYDPRDKLYGLLPLLAPRARASIDVNYKKDEVYTFEQALRIVWDEMSTAQELRRMVAEGTSPAFQYLDECDNLLARFRIRSQPQMTMTRLVSRKVARELDLRRRWRVFRGHFVGRTGDFSLEEMELHFDFLEWGCDLNDIRAKSGGRATEFARVHDIMKICVADAVAALRCPSDNTVLVGSDSASAGPRL